jgi:hypothetical protein
MSGGLSRDIWDPNLKSDWQPTKVGGVRAILSLRRQDTGLLNFEQGPGVVQTAGKAS